LFPFVRILALARLNPKYHENPENTPPRPLCEERVRDEMYFTALRGKRKEKKKQRL
jgi:hypothetical protein